MSGAEGTEPAKEPRRAKKGPQPSSPVSISPPSARLEAMTRERIAALEEDKRRLQAEVDQLRARVDQLGPENSRLDEALGHAESNGVLATILVGTGGFLVSYATFTGQATLWANGAAGCLIAGIVMMLWQSAYRRLRGGRKPHSSAIGPRPGERT
jgi:hypothetical protein